MSKYKNLLKEALRLEKNERPYAIATVISVTGSSSARVGDKAIFDEKGQRIMGYIGGGCIENTVSDVAIETLIIGIPKTVDIDLAYKNHAYKVGPGAYAFSMLIAFVRFYQFFKTGTVNAF